jgi:phage baseplate assembly protein V
MLGFNRSDQQTSGVGSAEGTDHARRLANVIRYGVVAEADYEQALIRLSLQDGEITTDWIPWITLRAGADRFWWAPEVGEVMLVLAPSGDLATAVALPAAFSNSNQNGDRATVQRSTFSDGTVVEYDREAHKLFMDVKGDVRIKATGKVDIEADGNVKIVGARIDLNP